MNHHEIEQQEIIERYTIHRLSAMARKAFQEHYFGCDECFSKVQTMAQFVAATKHSSRRGILYEVESESVAVAWWANWFKPAFALASAAAVLLAIGLGWTLFSQIPKLREELARERQAREQISDEKYLSNEKLKRLEGSKDMLEDALGFKHDALATAKAKQAKLQAQLNQIAQNKPTGITAPIEQVQSNANAPIVLLESQRDAKSESNLLALPSAAKTATLWIEFAPDSRFTSYKLQIFNQEKKLLTTINGAKLNSYGALAVNVPARVLSSAKYVIKAFGIKDSQHELIGEYDLTVLKK